MRSRHAWRSRLIRQAPLGPLLVAAMAWLQAQAPTPAQDMAHPQNTNAGIYAFTGHCARCHDTGQDGAQDRYALNRHMAEETAGTVFSRTSAM